MIHMDANLDVIKMKQNVIYKIYIFFLLLIEYFNSNYESFWVVCLLVGRFQYLLDALMLTNLLPKTVIYFLQ